MWRKQMLPPGVYLAHRWDYTSLLKQSNGFPHLQDDKCRVALPGHANPIFDEKKAGDTRGTCYGRG